MKLNRVFAFVFVCMFLTLAHAGAQIDTPVIPDYSNWEKSGPTEVPVVLGGKDATISGEVYLFTDFQNLRRHLVVVFSDQKGNPWLTFHTEEIGERHLTGSVSTKEVNFFIFQNVNGRWVFIKKWLNMKNISECAEFVKNTFNLEFR